MGTTELTPVELMVTVIKDHTPRSIWTDSPLEGYRHVGNTNRGAIGEDFLERYLTQFHIPVERGSSRVTATDLQIAGEPFEVKTASLGANGTFQFNHVRLDKPYRYLLCLGVCPQQIVFAVWRKGLVAEGEAGKLVRMAEGQSITFKLTKKLEDLHPIEELVPWVNEIM